MLTLDWIQAVTFLPTSDQIFQEAVSMSHGVNMYILSSEYGYNSY